MYILVTTDNGVTIDERPINGIQEGKAILNAICQRLRQTSYLPLIGHNETSLTYNVEELSEYGAENHKIQIGISTR